MSDTTTCPTCHGSGMVTATSSTKPRRGINGNALEPCVVYGRCPTCPDDGSGESKGTGRVPVATPKLTPRQAAIIGAYTGILCGPFSDLHEYVGGLPGFKGCTQVSFAMFAKEIAEAAKADFLALCCPKEDA